MIAYTLLVRVLVGSGDPMTACSAACFIGMLGKSGTFPPVPLPSLPLAASEEALGVCSPEGSEAPAHGVLPDASSFDVGALPFCACLQLEWTRPSALCFPIWL